MTAVARSGRDGGPAPRTIQPHLSAYAERLMDASGGRPVTWEADPTPLRHDFRYGRPSFYDFPHETWCRILARRARRASVRQLDYGPPAGRPELRHAIAEYLWRSRGVVCTPEQVIVVGGSQQALDLTARVLLDSGDTVVLEEPHYPGARLAFAASGARVISAPVDEEGIQIADLDDSNGPLRLAYLTPAHQFPTGVLMPLQRRLELLAWADREDVLLFEDDYDSEFRYEGRPVESLQGLDRVGRVIYAGTFSKLMFPALRLGYLVLPKSLVAPFVAAKGTADTGSPTLEQLALADFIRAGHFERHLRRSRTRNAARRAAMVGALRQHMGDKIEISGANAGLHLLVWLRKVGARRESDLRRRAAKLGVGIYPVRPYYTTPPKRAGFILGYASLDEKEIREGIKRFAQALNG
jgi:GntR family transcriptional regulator/MocR family aminotransferase